MAIDFDVEMGMFRYDEEDLDTTAAAIETWLDALSITTVHSLNIEYVHGFLVCIVVYV